MSEKHAYNVPIDKDLLGALHEETIKGIQALNGHRLLITSASFTMAASADGSAIRCRQAVTSIARPMSLSTIANTSYVHARLLLRSQCFMSIAQMCGY